DAGTPVTITARPATGSMVASWSIVNCGRATTCQVTMSQAQTVSVTFTKLMYLLTVNRSLLGTGSGSVAGNGIDCPLGACAVWLDPATSVTLTQAAAAGSAFTGWSGGGCGGSGATCSFTIGVDTTVTATFASLENVTIAKAGLATGTVTSNVGGIACDQTCTSQTVQIPYGTPVTLSQAPFGTAVFIGWSIGTCGATCPFTVTGARTVTATFDPPKYTVTVTTASVDSGAGTISSNPTGVVCLSPCKSTYAGSFYENTPVTLTAAPASGSYVVGWTGGCVSSTASCTVTMSEAKNVTATFGKPVLRVTKLSYAAGAGSITATYQSGNRTVTLFSCTTKQNCTTTSGTAPTVGQTVTVTVNPDTGSAFTGWGGDCATFGAATTCTLVMDTAKTITAAFGKPIPVDVALTGAGSVAISWAGGSQACSSTCSLTVTAGSTVTFVATASVGYAFLQWSGSCATAGTATTCVLDTLTTSASVTAEFWIPPPPPPA
ncbi:MAG: InlB B-repeat-containing protein, partial [Actinomycetota bacterium]